MSQQRIVGNTPISPGWSTGLAFLWFLNVPSRDSEERGEQASAEAAIATGDGRTSTTEPPEPDRMTAGSSDGALIREGRAAHGGPTNDLELGEGQILTPRRAQEWLSGGGIAIVQNFPRAVRTGSARPGGRARVRGAAVDEVEASGIRSRSGLLATRALPLAPRSLSTRTDRPRGRIGSAWECTRASLRALSRGPRF